MPLRSCSLVAKSLVPSCRRHLFRTITFTSQNVGGWLQTFPVPEESPACYVKDLCLLFGGRCDAPEEFFKHTPWFTNVEKMALKGNMMFPSRVVGSRETLERSFDFSRFPRLQTVTIDLHWIQGPLHYITTALSTLKPSTSPHLSHVHLRFTGPTCSAPYLASGTSDLEDLGSDLRQIADELSRIEREYEGAVKLRVFQSPDFELLDRLNVRFSFLWGWTKPHYEIVAHSS